MRFSDLVKRLLDSGVIQNFNGEPTTTTAPWNSVNTRIATTEHVRNASVTGLHTLDNRNNLEVPVSGRRGLEYHFKTATALGLPGAVSGDFVSELVLRPWEDATGGPAHSLVFDKNGSVYHRHANSATAWPAQWTQLAKTLSPIFEGNPRAPTPSAASNDTSIATTAFVKNQLASFVSDPIDTAPLPPSKDILFFDGAIPRGLRVNRQNMSFAVDRQNKLKLVNPNTLRHSYHPTIGTYQGALTEWTATNLLLQSENFGSGWTQTNVVPSTGSDSTFRAPDGNNTASLVRNVASEGAHELQRTASGVSPNAWYTFSIFVKHNKNLPASSDSKFGLEIKNGGVSLGETVFDIIAGTVSSLTATPTLQKYTNDWWRASITVRTPSSISAFTPTLFAVDRTTGARSFSNTNFLLVWGAQLERHSAPTSYVPTTFGAATRPRDLLTLDVNSNWFNPSESTVFWEGTVVATTLDTVESGGAFFGFDSGGPNDAFTVYRATPQHIGVQCVVGAISLFSNAYTATTFGPLGDGTFLRIAVSFDAAKASTFFACNGASVEIPHSAGQFINFTQWSTLRIGHIRAGPAANATHRRFTVFPKALTATSLQKLTKV